MHFSIFFTSGRIRDKLFDKLTKKYTLMKKIGLLLLLLLQFGWLVGWMSVKCFFTVRAMWLKPLSCLGM